MMLVGVPCIRYRPMGIGAVWGGQRSGLRKNRDPPDPAASLLHLQSLSMRRLFDAVAADRHAAPSARMASGVIGKHQRTGRTLTCLHIREVFLANEFRQRFADRQQQRLRRPPSAHRSKLQSEAAAVAAGRYPPEPFVAFEQPVERRQFVQTF